MIARIHSKHKPKRWPGHQPDEYFYFTLVGNNGEPIAQSEQYTQKHNVTELLRKYFPTFEVHDETVH